MNSFHATTVLAFLQYLLIVFSMADKYKRVKITFPIKCSLNWYIAPVLTRVVDAFIHTYLSSGRRMGTEARETALEWITSYMLAT